MAESFIHMNPHFVPFFLNDSRFCISYGGAGSGKSRAAAQKVIKRCLEEPGHRFLVVRKTHTSIKETTFQEIVNVLEGARLMPYVKINMTDLSISFYNRSKIITTGLDNVEKLKSIVITSTWCEEVTEFDLSDFQQIDLRLRGKSPGYRQHIMTFNPISETHWIKSVYFDQPREDTYVIHSTFEHNQYVDPGYVNALRSWAYDENMARIYLEGKWGRIRTGLEFYSSFRYATHVGTYAVDTTLPIHASFDQNVVPYCTATIWQLSRVDNRYKVTCIDEITLSNPRNRTDEVCREIIYRYPAILKNGFYYYGDATGRKRDTRGQENDYDIIEREMRTYVTNHSCRVPGSNPGVSKRRDFINRMLAGVFNIDVRIDAKCVRTIADFENVKEAEDRTKLKQVKRDKVTGASFEEYGHCFVGSTSIATTTGNIQIKDIKAGDYVHTLDGPRLVEKVWNNGYKRVKTYDIAGHKLTATPDHKVAIFFKNTRSITWKSLNNCLSLTQNYVLWKNGATEILNTIMVTHSHVIPNHQTCQTSDIIKAGLKLTGNCAKLIYTAISGIKHMENRLKVIMFTILTAMLIIMTFLILSVFRLSSILVNIGIKALKNIKRVVKSAYSNRLNPLQQRGIKAMRGGNGIRDTLKNQYSSVNQFRNSARNAGQCMNESQRPKINTVQQGVKTDTMQGGGVLLNFMALVLAKYQICLNSNTKQRVYDLTIEGERHYFANGVLVHNCSDTVDYFLCENFRTYFDR